QRLGSSARLLRSASRICALSQSKMPPEQDERFLDGLDELLRFGTHGCLPGQCDFWILSLDIVRGAAAVNASRGFKRCRARLALPHQRPPRPDPNVGGPDGAGGV